MMQKIKRPVSILLSILMVLSLFTVIPIASASAEGGTIYNSGEHEVSELNTGDYIVCGVESFMDSECEYTITLKAGTYTDWPAGETAYDEGFTADSGMFEVGTDDGILYFDDWNNGYYFMPFVDDAIGNAFYVESADHDAKTITLAGANLPAAPTYTLTCTDALVDAFDVWITPQFFDVGEDNWDVYAEKGVAYTILSEPDDYDFAVAISVEVPNGTAFNASDITVTMGDAALTLGEVSDLNTDKDVVVVQSDYSTSKAYSYFIRKGELTGDLVVDYAPAEPATEAPTPAKPQAGDVLPESDYLTFTAVEAGSSVTMTVDSGSNMQYNKNNSGWDTYYPATEIALENVGDSVSFSGTDVTFDSGHHVTIGGKAACSGNVMSLRLSDGVIQGLSDECFSYMFAYCDGLTTAPELPETALASNCYSSMFADCTSLTAAPELPATTLEYDCYRSMFAGCGKLTTAPELPATTLADNCYNCMFEGCTSLTAAPELPATTLEGNCYNSMFMGCQSLSELPELPATALASFCYYNMFSYCPKIYISDEAGTFDGITYSVEYRIPSSGTAGSEMYALNDMFGYTGGKFKGTPNLNTTYYIPAPELPDVIKDCTYKSPEWEVYANVPLISYLNLDTEIASGNPYIAYGDPEADDGQVAVGYSAKDYNYKFYDKSGNEIIPIGSHRNVMTGSEIEGLGVDKVYTFQYDLGQIYTPLYVVATELPDVIKDCTYKYPSDNVFANVPFIVSAADFSPLVDGAIYVGTGSGVVQLYDAKGYSYIFYDKTGTEFAATLSSEQSMPGSKVGLSDDVTLNIKLFAITLPENLEALYIVATAPAESDDKFVRAQNYEEVYYAASTTKEQAVEWATAHLDELKAERSAAGDKNLWIVYNVNVGMNYAEYIVLDQTGNLVTDGEFDNYLTPILSFMIDDGDIIYYAPTVLPENAEALYLFDYYDPDEEEFAAEHTGTNVKITPSADNIEVSAGWEFNTSVSANISALNGKNITKIEVTTTKPNRVKMTVDGSVVSGTAVGNVVTYDNINATEAVLTSGSSKHIVSKIVVYYTDGEPAPTTYTVTWKNGDGTTLKTDTVDKDTAPAYSGNVPEKAEDETFTYYFSGWTDGTNTYGATDTLPAVTGDITYTATFDATAKFEEGYYLVGTFTNWKVDPAYKLAANPAAEGEYMITQVALTTTDGFKVVYAKPGEAFVWYPDGVDNNISVENNDKYNIYFRPNGIDDEAWDYGVIFVERYVPAESTEVINAINALPDAESVTLADAQQINAARNAYEALNDEQKGYIDADTLKKLTDAEAAIADLEAAGAVETLIYALPAEVTLADKTDVEAARAAYDALTDDQKAQIDLPTLTRLTNAEERIADLEAAAAVEALINALPAAADVAITDANDIIAARQAYDALTEPQKFLIDSETYMKLVDAELASQQIADDVNAVSDVVTQIEDLPAASDVTLADEININAARMAYDMLTDSQKAMFPEQALKKLTDAEAALADLKAADAVETLINALPTEITLYVKQNVESAREAFDALTDAQKALVDADVLDKLVAAEAAIADLEAAVAVETLIDALPLEITLADKTDVEAARAAYDALTDAQKDLIDAETLAVLTDAEAAIADLEAAAAVETMINALPAEITLADKTDVEAAREAYDALTDAQKDLIDAEILAVLTDAEAALADLKAADAVEALIDALPEQIALTDKDNVEIARQVYDALTDAQKDLIDADTLAKLTDAEAVIADLEAAAAVETLINALPAEITLADKTDVEAAREAYDALTDDQKALVDADTLQKLTDAEAAYEALPLLGDTDGDGEVTILDVTAIQRYLASLPNETFVEAVADVDGDGEISILDATYIQRWLVSIDDGYPIGSKVNKA